MGYCITNLTTVQLLPLLKKNERENIMKGYYTSTCFMGWIPRFHQYLPFATEKEYIGFFKEMESSHENPSN